MNGSLTAVVWPSAPASLKLSWDEVHVFYTSLEVSDRRLETLEKTLYPFEQERADRFRFPQDRKHYIAGRGILREITGAYLKKDPSRLVFKYNSYGKPFLLDDSYTIDLSFNLSHSRGTALYAFTIGRDVGIDIEYMRSDVVEDSTAEHTFSKNEIAALRDLPRDIQTRAFFNCWTRKEAFIKAKGQGLSIALDQFDVSIIPGEPAKLLRTEWDAAERNRWTLEELNVGAEYAASLAVKDQEFILKCWEWPGQR
jgi:4'-phosphopantetheinyl transferase